MGSFEANGVVTLTSDFGTVDGYVGAMKGAVLREHAGARLVDLTHEVAPQDVFAGAFALAQATRTFPAGTVHLAVVDPGVGSSRRALIVDHGGQRFVGPDNGLLSLAAPPGPSTAWRIDRVPGGWTVHPTFHGRDLFARVAGRLSAGAQIASFSTTEVSDPVDLAPAHLAKGGGAIAGPIVHVDRFGNLVTAIDAAAIEALQTLSPAGAIAIEVAGRAVPWVRTYADVARGEVLAYLGSAGLLEIAVRDGSAAERLGITRGATVRVRADR